MGVREWFRRAREAAQAAPKRVDQHRTFRRIAFEISQEKKRKQTELFRAFTEAGFEVRDAALLARDGANAWEKRERRSKGLAGRYVGHDGGKGR